MATKQIDGVTNVTKTSTVNNGGIAAMHGTPASNVFGAQSMTPEKVGVFGSTVIDNDSANKALKSPNSGTFAYNNERPVAKKLTTSLSGENNDFLLSGAAVPSNVRGIHKLEKVTTRRATTAIRQGYWSYYTGKFDPGYPVVAVDNFYDISTDALVANSTDDAAKPTRKLPGELTFMVGKTPTHSDYKSKT